MGRKKFNMDPKKVHFFDITRVLTLNFFVSFIVTDFSNSLQGIVFLVENELLRHTPEDIAQFLYKGEGLNKTAIGDYLGERCLVPQCPLAVLSFCISHFNPALSATVLQG